MANGLLVVTTKGPDATTFLLYLGLSMLVPAAFKAKKSIKIPKML
jgi:hypothetical protein